MREPRERERDILPLQPPRDLQRDRERDRRERERADQDMNIIRAVASERRRSALDAQANKMRIAEAAGFVPGAGAGGGFHAAG